MKLKAQLSDIEHDVELGLRDDFASGAIDDRRYEVEVRELSDGVYLLIHASTVYRCRVEPAKGGTDVLAVTVRGKDREVKIIDPKRLRSGQSSGAHQHGSVEISSPMPGKVVRVLCEVGAKVEAGTGIVVVEAMKMQNELKTPKAGIVVSINAESGATVNAGDVLAVIE